MRLNRTSYRKLINSKLFDSTGGDKMDWSFKFKGKNIIEQAENFCSSELVKNTDIEQYLRFTLNKIKNNEPIELENGRVLIDANDKLKFLEEEIDRAIRHIIRIL